jgi:hypothetical protein
VFYNSITLFEQKYPLSFVSVKARAVSDHVPLILNRVVRRRKNKIFSDLKSGGWNSLISRTWL